MKRCVSLVLCILFCIGLLAACAEEPAPATTEAPVTTETETSVTSEEPATTEEPETTLPATEPASEPEVPTETEPATQPTTAVVTDATTKATDKTAATTVRTTGKTTTAKKKTVAEIYKSLKSADRDCEEYNLDKYMQNLWTGNVVYNESVMVVANKDGSIDPIQLMYPADRILAVHDSTLNHNYFEGDDYKLENGCLVLTAGSKITVTPWETYYPASGKMRSVISGRYLAFAEGSYFHQRQIAVSYIHTADWTGNAPVSKADLLPRTVSKLKKGEPLNVVFTGDSITCGGNYSGGSGMDPKAPNWADMTCAYWQKTYNSKINSTNIAVGGITSVQGVDMIDKTWAPDPDLVVIAYGMNDSPGRSTEKFIKNITDIMNGVRAHCPDCEFILVSSMLSNPLESPNRGSKLYDYRDGLYALEKTGVAVADVTACHEGLLTRKNYYDMTGNNINHPNDFLSRVYAQTLAFMVG